MPSEPNDSTPQHEIKFISSSHNIDLILQWLNLTCYPDPEFPCGIVSSIYYDTREWHFLREKVNSDFLKTKIRLRWYLNVNQRIQGDASFLEVKYKIGLQRKKIRIGTSYTAEWLSKVSLSDHKLLKIPLLLGINGIVLKYNLFPAFIINYKRYRFVEHFSGARICLDFKINVPKFNRLLIPDANSAYLNVVVLEVKGGIDCLPKMLSHLINMGFKKTSFSKYSACYKKIKRIEF